MGQKSTMTFPSMLSTYTQDLVYLQIDLPPIPTRAKFFLINTSQPQVPLQMETERR